MSFGSLSITTFSSLILSLPLSLFSSSYTFDHLLPFIDQSPRKSSTEMAKLTKPAPKRATYASKSKAPRPTTEASDDDFDSDDNDLTTEEIEERKNKKTNATAKSKPVVKAKPLLGGKKVDPPKKNSKTPLSAPPVNYSDISDASEEEDEQPEYKPKPSNSRGGKKEEKPTFLSSVKAKPSKRLFRSKEESSNPFSPSPPSTKPSQSDADAKKPKLKASAKEGPATKKVSVAHESEAVPPPANSQEDEFGAMFSDALIDELDKATAADSSSPTHAKPAPSSPPAQKVKNGKPDPPIAQPMDEQLEDAADSQIEPADEDDDSLDESQVKSSAKSENETLKRRAEYDLDVVGQTDEGTARVVLDDMPTLKKARHAPEVTKVAPKTAPASHASPKITPRSKTVEVIIPSPSSTAEDGYTTLALDKDLVLKMIVAKLDSIRNCDWYELSVKLAKDGVVRKVDGKKKKGQEVISGNDLHDLYHNMILPALRSGRALCTDDASPPSATEIQTPEDEAVQPIGGKGDDDDDHVEAPKTKAKVPAKRR